MSIIAAHGGSASNPRHEDGPRRACEAGLAAIAAGHNALESVLAATVVLEDDERFNAGTGSNLRLDGRTIQMDASCMTSAGAFAGVAAVERVRNPIRVAEQLLETPHVLLVGEGATAFARERGLEDFDPTTTGARERYERVLSRGRRNGDGIGAWSRADLERSWNFPTPFREALGCDTVGAVAWDGEIFAAALSTGGTSATLRGRVGDVPLPGCGLYAGPFGALALTGDGEHIARGLLAYRGYLELAGGRSPAEVVGWVLEELPDEVDVGVIAIDASGFAGGARHRMAWHGRVV